MHASNITRKEIFLKLCCEFCAEEGFWILFSSLIPFVVINYQIMGSPKLEKFEDLVLLMNNREDDLDHEQQRDSSRNPRVHFDIPSKEVDPTTHRQTSVSSASSGSLDLDAIENILNGVSPEYENAGLEMQGPTSAAAEDHAANTPLLSNQNVLFTQFAQTQFMGTPAGYDPNRIPLSIFSNIPTTPMDWSTASNESLFSIQIENSSFSRDNFIILNKSGELPRLDESESADHEGRNSEVTDQASSQTSKVAWWKNPEYDDDMIRKVSLAVQIRNSNAMSCRSDESNHSAHSFNFPLLTGSTGLSSPVTMDLKRQQLQQQSQPQNKRIYSKRAWVKMFDCLGFRSRCF